MKFIWLSAEIHVSGTMIIVSFLTFWLFKQNLRPKYWSTVFMLHVCFIMTVIERIRGKERGMKHKRERLFERTFSKKC